MYNQRMEQVFWITVLAIALFAVNEASIDLNGCGGFLNTCTILSIEGQLLEASCKTIEGPATNTTINVKECGGIARCQLTINGTLACTKEDKTEVDLNTFVDNTNGTLVCCKGGDSCGGFLETCTLISYDKGTGALAANCTKMNGEQNKNARLNVKSCSSDVTCEFDSTTTKITCKYSSAGNLVDLSTFATNNDGNLTCCTASPSPGPTPGPLPASAPAPWY